KLPGQAAFRHRGAVGIVAHRGRLLDTESRSVYSRLTCESQKLIHGVPARAPPGQPPFEPLPSYSTASALLHPIGRRAITTFAVSEAIEKALPLVAVINQDAPGRIARHPHQHPVPAGLPGRGDHGHLDGAVARTRPLPLLGGHVDP